jgi:hypothetical protein
VKWAGHRVPGNRFKMKPYQLIYYSCTEMVGALIIKSENTAGVVKCVNTVYRNYVLTIINFAEKRVCKFLYNPFSSVFLERQPVVILAA